MGLSGTRTHTSATKRARLQRLQRLNEMLPNAWSYQASRRHVSIKCIDIFSADACSAMIVRITAAAMRHNAGKLSQVAQREFLEICIISQGRITTQAISVGLELIECRKFTPTTIKRTRFAVSEDRGPGPSCFALNVTFLH